MIDKNNLNDNQSYIKRSSIFYVLISILKILKGHWITLRYIFTKKVTLNYPNERSPISNRFRGEHVLRKYDNGEERCIACKMCEAICPAQAITIDNKHADETDSPMRRTFNYDIDMTKCIYCGLCEEACPVSAIVESHNFEFVSSSRVDLMYSKNKLLDNGEIWKKVVDQKLYKKAKNL